MQILPGNPPVIEFGTVATTVSGNDNIDTRHACLRIPIGRLARVEAVCVPTRGVSRRAQRAIGALGMRTQASLRCGHTYV